MKLLSATEAEAQVNADRAHKYLIETDAGYASSATAGQTVGWATPQVDDAGQWSILVEPKCLGAFSEDELKMLDEPVMVDEFVVGLEAQQKVEA